MAAYNFSTDREIGEAEVRYIRTARDIVQPHGEQNRFIDRYDDDSQ